MNIRNFLFIVIPIISATHIGHSQSLQMFNPFKKSTPTTELKYELTADELKNVKNDVIQLSMPNMKGRVLGTTGEVNAAAYLAKRLKDIGLREVDKNYAKKFNYSIGQLFSSESRLTFNNQSLKVPSEAYPVSFSGLNKLDSYYISEEQEPHTVWVVPAFSNANEAKLSIAERENLLYNKAKKLQHRGAWGIVFYNNINNEVLIPFQHKTILQPLTIPVFEIPHLIFQEKFKGIKKMTPLSLEPLITEINKQSSNIYGIINNGAEQSIMISANYDGIIPSNDNSISPGANNNASGVAMVLALAQRLMTTPSNYNYIFMLYSGTNANLIGSQKLFQDKTFFAKKLAFAIHFDKVGRPNPNKEIIVSGIGTAPIFKSWFNKKRIFPYELNNKGADQSDYQTYYANQIPYLSYSTGNNNDHGTVQDIHNKMNYDIMNEMMSQVYEMLLDVSKNKPNINFTQTKDEEKKVVPIVAKKIETQPKKDIPQPKKEEPKKSSKVVTQPIANKENANAPKLNKDVNTISKNDTSNEEIKDVVSTIRSNNYNITVSLGVVPDLQYVGGGLKLLKINKNKDADQVGIKEGDIIIQIKNIPIQNYDDYMLALSKCKKGDKALIKISRKGNIIQRIITFS